MKKSVYSLVLADEVIEAADEEAYRQGLSRSALINRILAEYLSLKTPEHVMQEIFETMRRRIEAPFLIEKQTSDSQLYIRSQLKYKYRPTIRYNVELYPEAEDSVFGRLRVSFRTQNAALLGLIILEGIFL